ncbi:bacteriorhodopsin [Cryobacterium melibiosiphilum]|nr:bacteriorhodopsin [Cryobacterium melibiosiphilum]
MNTTIVAPWTATLTESQYMLTQYFLVIAALALFAGFVRTWTTRGEVGARYRPAVVARLSLMGVAFLGYVYMVINFRYGYDLTAAGYVPNELAINAMATRYMDWSLTVPLLTVELLAVCTVVGAAARRVRIWAVAGAFLMIFTGYLGAVVIGGGTSLLALVVWGGISCAFWIATMLLLIREVRRSLPELTTESATLLRSATFVLLGGWFIYPVMFMIPLLGSGGAFTTAMQIGYCIADIFVKVVFCGLIHRVAKLRTAEDVRSGLDVHHEAIWISSVKQSDAGLPREVYLDDGSTVHHRRPQPPLSSAVPTAPTKMPGYIEP